MTPQTSPAPAPADPAPPARLSPEQWLAGLAMLLIVLISLGNVVVRYFTARSFAATEEFSIALLILLAFLGSATAFACDRHIRVTFFLRFLPAPVRRHAQDLTLACTVTLFGLIGWYGARLAWDHYRFEETSPALGLPQWWYTVWMPLLAVALVLRLLWTRWRAPR